MFSFASIGKYQLAVTTFFEGNASNAAALYKTIIEDKAVDSGLAGRAARSRILAFDALGDDDSVEAYSSSPSDSLNPTAQAQVALLKFNTLRFGIKKFDRKFLELAGNYPSCR